LFSDSHTVPLLLSLLGVALISISGWLGGELVFKHGVAVVSDSETPPDKPAAARRAA
jgi:uncharacterized membrane protein